MLSEIKVGIQNYADGSTNTARQERTGGLVVAQAHGGYTEAALRGAIMEVSNAVAGVAHGTALSTTPPMTLWNPPSSGKNLSILKACMGYVSGTLGAGSIVMGAVLSQVTVPTGGVELTPLCSMLGLPRGVGRTFTGSTLASTPQIVRPLFVIGAFVGGATTPTDTVDVIDGSVIVTPGTAVVLQGVATAGTSPLVNFGFTWEEIPV